jgi:hypothetical protein
MMFANMKSVLIATGASQVGAHFFSGLPLETSSLPRITRDTIDNHMDIVSRQIYQATGVAPEYPTHTIEGTIILETNSQSWKLIFFRKPIQNLETGQGVSQYFRKQFKWLDQVRMNSSPIRIVLVLNILRSLYVFFVLNSAVACGFRPRLL